VIGFGAQPRSQSRSARNRPVRIEPGHLFNFGPLEEEKVERSKNKNSGEADSDVSAKRCLLFAGDARADRLFQAFLLHNGSEAKKRNSITPFFRMPASIPRSLRLAFYRRERNVARQNSRHDASRRLNPRLLNDLLFLFEERQVLAVAFFLQFFDRDEPK